MKILADVPWWVWLIVFWLIVGTFFVGLARAASKVAPEPEPERSEEFEGRGIRVNPGREPF